MKIKPHVVCGYIAALCFSIMLIPQLYKSNVTKSTEDISVCFVYILLFGSILMAFYSYTVKAYPVLLNNISVGIIAILLIITYYRYNG